MCGTAIKVSGHWMSAKLFEVFYHNLFKREFELSHSLSWWRWRGCTLREVYFWKLYLFYWGNDFSTVCELTYLRNSVNSLRSFSPNNWRFSNVLWIVLNWGSSILRNFGQLVNWLGSWAVCVIHGAEVKELSLLKLLFNSG